MRRPRSDPREFSARFFPEKKDLSQSGPTVNLSVYLCKLKATVYIYVFFAPISRKESIT